MTEGELATLLASHETRAVSYYNSEIAGEQEQAIVQSITGDKAPALKVGDAIVKELDRLA